MTTYRLLQARTPDEPVREEERAAFASQLGVPAARVLPWDLLEGNTTFERVTEDVDVVLVGGSGHFSVLDGEPWLPPFIQTLGELAERGFPTFASCFGFQGMVLALGGRVVHDASSAEVGTFELTLTAEGQLDPLFSALPQRFPAQLGHKDRATDLPAGVRCLAASDRCPYQAIRVGELPVYATQFHPELDRGDNLQRFQRYYQEYSEAFGARRAQAILDSFRASPDACALLRRFVERLQGGALGSPAA